MDSSGTPVALFRSKHASVKVIAIELGTHQNTHNLQLVFKKHNIASLYDI